MFNEELRQSKITLPKGLQFVEPLPNNWFARQRESSIMSEEQYFDARDLREVVSMKTQRKYFWNTLVAAVARSGYVPPSERITEVISIGCGIGEEVDVLSAFFGGQMFASISDQVHVIGIENDSRKMSQALGEYQHKGHTFILGDATNLSDYPVIPEQVDVVMIRHHDPSNKAAWEALFCQGLGKLDSNGILISTSYSSKEHQLLTDMLKEQDCSIVINELNPHAMPLGIDEGANDKHILIARVV